MVAVAVAAGFLGAYLALTLAGPHTAGLGLWLRDFAKTPGAGGVAAVLAAGLAFWGISRQVRVSRANLELERDREQARSWWQSFEWAVSRAVPLDAGHVALREDVSVNTFNALRNAASTDVQLSACGGMIDILTARNDAEPLSSRGEFPGPETSVIDQDSLVEKALASYVREAEGTAGESAGARARLYELQLMNAIHGVQDQQISVLEIATGVVSAERHRPTYQPDALLLVNGREVLVDIRYYAKSTNFAPGGLRRTLASIRGQGATAPLLLVTNRDRANVDSILEEFSAELLVWESSKDNQALRASLLKVAALPPWTPQGNGW